MNGDFYDETTITFSARGENESFARVAAAAFALRLDPEMGEIEDIKTAVSEAVTNAIIHGYDENPGGVVEMRVKIAGRKVEIAVTDFGGGIEDIERAREPLYTSKPELERSGMGFTVMETFMDKVRVESIPGEGTTVTMSKTLK